jgi:exosortase
MDSKPAALTTRHVCFIAMVVVLAGIFHHALGVVVGSALENENYGHILLVWPISAVLLYSSANKILAAPSYSWIGGAAVVLFLAGFVYFSTRAADVNEDNYLSAAILFFILCCLAAFLSCYGTAAFRAGTFPLLFLLLTVPVPEFLLQPAISFLQDRSGDATCFLYRLAHVPYVRHGIVISLPKIDIQIAEECSGIRSTMVLVLSSLVLGHLYLRKWWSRTLFALAVIPITIAKNGLRIFFLSVAGTYWDPSFLTGRLHHQGGFVFFMLAFGTLMLLIWMLQKLEPGRTPADSSSPSPSPVARASF